MRQTITCSPPASFIRLGLNSFTIATRVREIIVLLRLQRRAASGDDDAIKNGVIVDPGGWVAYTLIPIVILSPASTKTFLGRSPSRRRDDVMPEKPRSRPDAEEARAQAIWNSSEHRELQVTRRETCSSSGHAAPPPSSAAWIKLLRRGQGEIAVEASILSSADYRLAHPTMSSYLAGLNHDVLGQPANPIDSKINSPCDAQGHRGRTSAPGPVDPHVARRRDDPRPAKRNHVSRPPAHSPGGTLRRGRAQAREDRANPDRRAHPGLPNLLRLRELRATRRRQALSNKSSCAVRSPQARPLNPLKYGAIS